MLSLLRFYLVLGGLQYRKSVRLNHGVGVSTTKGIERDVCLCMCVLLLKLSTHRSVPFRFFLPLLLNTKRGEESGVNESNDCLWADDRGVKAELSEPCLRLERSNDCTTA